MQGMIIDLPGKLFTKKNISISKPYCLTKLIKIKRNVTHKIKNENLNRWKSVKGIRNSSKKCPEKVTMGVTAALLGTTVLFIILIDRKLELLFLSCQKNNKY